MSSNMKYLVIPGDVLSNISLTSDEKMVYSDMKASHDYFVNRRGEEYRASFKKIAERLGMALFDVIHAVDGLEKKQMLSRSENTDTGYVTYTM